MSFNLLYLKHKTNYMKSFEQMYSEFYGAEIYDAAQINLYSHSGTELKDFVNYCIEQAGINPPVMQAEGSDGVSGAAVGQRSVDTNAEGEELLCFCANGGREGLHGICTNCGNYVGSSREGHL